MADKQAKLIAYKRLKSRRFGSLRLHQKKNPRCILYRGFFFFIQPCFKKHATGR